MTEEGTSNKDGAQLVAEDEEEDIVLYERYWAENTSAHGFGRIVSTTRMQRAFWVVALLGLCFRSHFRTLQFSFSAPRRQR